MSDPPGERLPDPPSRHDNAPSAPITTPITTRPTVEEAKGTGVAKKGLRRKRNAVQTAATTAQPRLLRKRKGRKEAHGQTAASAEVIEEEVEEQEGDSLSDASSNNGSPAVSQQQSVNAEQEVSAIATEEEQLQQHQQEGQNDSPLLQATLVTNDSVVYIAEPAAPPDSFQDKCIRFLSSSGGKLCCLFTTLALTAVAITGIVCGSGLCTPDDDSGGSPTDIIQESSSVVPTVFLRPSAAPSVAMAPTTTEPPIAIARTEPPDTTLVTTVVPTTESPSFPPSTAIPTQNPTFTPLECPDKGTQPCLATREELLNAVDQFLDFGILFNSQPMGCWCFDPGIQNFGDLFDGSEFGRREDTKATLFNEDLSLWDVSSATSLYRIFRAAESFNSNISGWNVGKVQDMGSVFRGATSFNQDLASWDVGMATNMYFMFDEATSFNLDISGWNISSVSVFTYMFSGATSFRQNLCEWGSRIIPTLSSTMNFMFDGSNCPVPDRPDLTKTPKGPFCFSCCFSSRTDLLGAVDNFLSTSSAKGKQSEFFTDTSGPTPIEEWCFDGVGNFSSLFDVNRNPNALTFNSDISAWVTSDVTDMSHLFNGAFQQQGAFNQDLSGWDTSQVTSMERMFYQQPFNANLSSWNTERVLSFYGMFWNAAKFNGDISSWDVSSATTLKSLFNRASSFNADISSWDVESALDTSYMFYAASSFNIDVSGWNISASTNFREMFGGAAAFQQDLCPWGEHIMEDPEQADGVFFGTACPTQSDPNPQGNPAGPFCFACY